MSLKRKTNRGGRNRNGGIAATELACGLPVIVLLIFGALQMSYAIQLRHLGLLIIDEVAREANDNATTDFQLQARATELANAAGINNHHLSIGHDTSNNLVSLEIGIPLSGNFSGPQLIHGQQIKASTVAYRNYNLE